MHKDLEDLLNQVWKERKDILAKSPTGHSGRGIHLGDRNEAIWVIYKIYNSMGGSGDTGGFSSSDLSMVSEFIDEIDSLEKAVGSGAIIQRGDQFYDLNRGQLSNVKAKAIEVTSRQKEPLTLERSTLCGDIFVHFSAGRRVKSQHRIYMNVKHAARGKVFHELTRMLWSEPCLSTCKVACPVITRADTILFYFSEGKGFKDIVEKIRLYYDRNKGHFLGSTPKLTVPVEGMPGVALAMEPPSLTLIRSGGEFYAQPVGQSFGFYRASIIFMALDRTKSSIKGQTSDDRGDAFKRRAEKYFRQAGIDPDRPNEQVAPQGLKPIDQLKITIEGEIDSDTGLYKPGAKVHKSSK